MICYTKEPKVPYLLFFYGQRSHFETQNYFNAFVFFPENTWLGCQNNKSGSSLSWSTFKQRLCQQ